MTSSRIPKKWLEFTRKFNQLVDSGRGDRAIKVSKKLLTKKAALGPDFEIYITHTLAQHLERINDLEGARQYYTNILESIASSKDMKVEACSALASITLQLAVANSATCDERSVEEYYQFALRLEPNNIQILVSYAQFVVDRFFDSRKEDIERLFQQAESAVGSHTEMNLKYGQYLAETGHPIAALPKLQTVLNRRHCDPETSFEISLLYLAPDFKKPDESIRVLQDMLRLHEDNIQGLVHLAKVHAFMNFNADAAQMYFSKALEFDTSRSRCNSFRFFWDMFRNPPDEVDAATLDIDEKDWVWTRREIYDYCSIAETLSAARMEAKAAKFAQRAYVLDRHMGYRLQRVAFVYETTGTAPAESRRRKFREKIASRSRSRNRQRSYSSSDLNQYTPVTPTLSYSQSSRRRRSFDLDLDPEEDETPSATPSSQSHMSVFSPRSADSALNKWLRKHQLEHCSTALRSNGVESLDEVRQLTMSDLQLTPIRHTDQLMIMRAIKKDLWRRRH